MIEWRAGVLVLAGVLTLAACGGDGTDDAAGPPPSAATTTITVERPPADFELPVIESITSCGECTRVHVLGEPAVAVYADGRVVIARERFTEDASEIERFGVDYFLEHIDTPELDHLLVLAAAAGLATGTDISFPNPDAAVDAGSVDLVGRLDGKTATFDGPILSDDEYDDAEPQVRAANELDVALSDLADAASAPLPDAEFVLVGAIADVGRIDDSVPWTGPPLADLMVPLGDANGRSCAVVAAGVAPLLPRAWNSYFESGGDVWLIEGRPLFPHEHDCADVRTTLTR